MLRCALRGDATSALWLLTQLSSASEEVSCFEYKSMSYETLSPFLVPFIFIFLNGRVTNRNLQDVSLSDPSRIMSTLVGDWLSHSCCWYANDVVSFPNPLAGTLSTNDVTLAVEDDNSKLLLVLTLKRVLTISLLDLVLNLKWSLSLSQAIESSVCSTVELKKSPLMDFLHIFCHLLPHWS